MAQFFQIEGTQQVFMLQGSNSIGLQFASQESCTANQTNNAVLQHPQGVLLTDAIVSSPNRTIELVRYTNSQPPALYYHTTQQVVESHQTQAVDNSQGVQHSAIQIQQIPQLQQLQGTLVGNQVVHNHITNETYEVTVEETDEQIEGGELLYEAALAEDGSEFEPADAQSAVLSTSVINHKTSQPQCIPPNALPAENSQATPHLVQPQTVYKQLVQQEEEQQEENQQGVEQDVVQQQGVPALVSQPCVVQQIPVVQRTASVQQHHVITTDAAQVSNSNNNAITQGYIVGSEAAPKTVHSVFIPQPLQNEKGKLFQGIPVKQPPQLLQVKTQPQVIQQAKPQPQVLHVKQTQVIQTGKPQQVIQTVKPQNVIQTVKHQPQVIQALKQQPQVIQTIKQSPVIQTVNHQPQVIQTVKQYPQVIQSVISQPQVPPLVKQQTEQIKQPFVRKEIATSVHTIPHAGIKVTAFTPTTRVSVPINSLSKSEPVKKRRTPNITKRSVSQMKLNDINKRVNTQSPPVTQPLPATNSDLSASQVEKTAQSTKSGCLSGNLPEEQKTPTIPRTFLTDKGQLQLEENSERHMQSPQVTVQESPQSLVQLESPNTSTSTTPQLKSLVVHQTLPKQVQTISKPVQTYPSARNRFVTKAVTKEIVLPINAQKLPPKQVVSQQTLVIQRDNQLLKQNQVSTPQKDQVVLVMPQNRQLLQGNSNLRFTGGNKVYTIEEVMRDGFRVSQGITLPSGSNFVVIKSDNTIVTDDMKHLTHTDTIFGVEKPKLIPGKLAVCTYCGYSSTDFNRCSRCRRKLPPGCKVVDAKDATNEGVILDAEKLTTTSKTAKVVKLPIESFELKRRPKPPVRKPKLVSNVPECLTLSSDEEESNVDHEDELLDNPCGDLESDMENHDSADGQHSSSGIEGEGLSKQVSDGSFTGPLIKLTCRSVRIGSYKVKPLERVLLADRGVEVIIPLPGKEDESITIFINMMDIRRILLCPDRIMPTIFIHIRTSAAARIREILNMTDPNSEFYFNPDSKEEMHRRITLLPEKFNDEYRLTIMNIVPKDLLKEIAYLTANEILLKACPKSTQAQLRKNTSAISKIQTIMVYPPPPAKGGISINTEDYACLGEDVFLNDVIIDFYLKYLMLAVLSPEDRERTHVFSTFFYKRLTSPPGKTMRASHPVESNPNLSPAEKRHSRVKSWTKNVNLFTKDIVIIPINEKCHWFLAIICFPGQNGCVRMSDNTPVSLDNPALSSTPAAASSVATAAATAAAATAAAVAAASGSSKIKVNSNNVLSIGSTTITPVKAASDTITLDCNNGEEGSDRDEAEGDEDEMDDPVSEEDEESAAAPAATPEANTSVPENVTKTEIAQDVPKVEEKPKPSRAKCSKDAIKQPCILIFDSLMGAPRSRVVATLRDYLRIEHKAKQGEEKDFNKDTMKGMVPKVPQQKNFTDCGLYLLQYVEQFFKDPIKDYRPPIKTLKDWFPADVVRRKRQEIQLLLHQLMEDQKIDMSKLNLPHLTFSSQAKPDEGENAGLCLGGGEASAPEGAEDAAGETADEAAAGDTAAQDSAAEMVWGAAGAEEEVTTDGVSHHEDVPCDYEHMDMEECDEEELEGYEDGEVDGEAVDNCGEAEEGEMLEGEEAVDTGVCQVMDGAMLKTGVPRLVSYPDSPEDGWSPNGSPAPSPATAPTTGAMALSDSTKRIYSFKVRPNEAKRMKMTSDR